MEINQLVLAARVFVARNMNSDVVRATVSWDADASHLSLHYYTATVPTEDDLEEVEIVMAELLAEFSDVRTCETGCTMDSGQKAVGELVYLARSA